MTTPNDRDQPAWTKMLRPRPEGYAPPEARPRVTPEATTRFLDAPCLSKHPKTSPASAVEELERALGTTMPQGYKEYVTTFGEGLFAGFVRVIPPEQLPARIADWREGATKYFFWDTPASVALLDHQSRVEAIPIATTMGGDQFVFHPSNSGTLYALPRHEDEIVELVGSIDAVLDWALRNEATDLRYFEPDAKPRRFVTKGGGPSLDDVLEQLASAPGVTQVARGEDEDGLFAHVLLPEGEAHLLVLADYEGPAYSVHTVYVTYNTPEPTPLLAGVLDLLGKLGVEPRG